MIKPPPGYRFDPFADARLGRSLFQMSAEDWLVPASVDTRPKDEDPAQTGASLASGAVQPQAGDAQ